MAIGMWVAMAGIGVLYVALPGVSPPHTAVVLVCSGLAVAWAAVVALLPSNPKLMILHPLGAGLSMTTVSVMVWASGGGASPLRACLLLPIVYCACFLPPPLAVRMLAVAVAVNLLPLVYDASAFAGADLGWTIMLSATFIATGVAIVAERSKLKRTVAVNAERLKTIVALQREVEQAEFDVQEVVLGILDRARTLLRATAASAGIIEGEEIVYRYRTGPGRETGVAIHTPRYASLSGICADSGEAVYCADSEIDVRVDKDACRQQGLRSMIIAPLRHRGEVVGVLNINSPEPRAFGANDVQTVELVAGAISAAYGHAVDIAAKQLLLDKLEATVVALRDSEAKLSHQAVHDPLTGLPNRTLLLDRLRMALAERGDPQVALLFVDLDGFKVVNDSLGHDAGDALLVKAAERISGVLRPADTAARIGGDEFAILCKTSAPTTTGIAVAKRIIDALASPFRIAGREAFVTASIGIAAHDGTPEELLRDADVAMYRAKASGKGGYAVFEEEMRADAISRLELAADLQRALEERELVLHYQPIVELEEGQIVGYEGLIRWQHPQRGLLPPGAFIPLAEATGLIKPLGAWVLSEACRQMAAWHAEAPEGRRLYVSVNLSAHQIGDERIICDVREALAASGLPSESLVLELTETALMADIDTSAVRLRTLRQLGVQIAIDDFGTAYSSLHYLQQFPIGILKIAKPFIDGLTGSDSQAAMARAITNLGRNLGLDMVAEGIEQSEQLALLRELGCPHGQGFLFSTPLPPDQVTPGLLAGALWPELASA
ncbi:MAG TPA: EAL domain-containing protein [Solirubrobacteraceae bacterium]|nr:EAL domain-containing protein [Solirubrobacteraceae bacterium]